MENLSLNSVMESCSYYPVAMDLCRRVIWFARVERQAYSLSAFLVPRQAPMSEERYGFNLDDVLLHDLSLPIGGAPSHYIFISAFCCSTLLARLIDEIRGCLVLKEPSVLGQIAMLRYRPRLGEARKITDHLTVPQSEASSTARRAVDSSGSSSNNGARGEHVIPAAARIQHWAPACAGVTSPEAWEEDWRTWAALSIRLLTRTFEPGQTVIVKAADVCNTMGDVLLANDPNSKAVLLSVGLRTFILSVLKLENRRVWTRKRATFWNKTLTLFPVLNEVNVSDLDDAQKAAYVWLVTAALWDRFRKQTASERLLLMDGEEVSEDPGSTIRRVAAFFCLPLEESRVEEILADPVLNHHSKFPGQAYDAAQRRRDRADWETRFGADTDRAMEWAAAIQDKLESDGVDLSTMAGVELKELAV